MSTISKNLIAGSYEIKKTLYHDPGNEIFVARRVSDGTTVFIKQSSKSREYLPGISRTANEYNILNALDHPGIPRVYEVLTDKNAIALVEEYIEGTSLKDRLYEAGIAEDDILDLAIQMAGILDHIHQRNVVHRNINPENIIVSEDWKVHLVDFDISSNINSQTNEIVAIDQIEGSLSYISPEQTGRTSYPVTTTSDIYSLGMVLYECLAGKPPFDSTDPLEVIHFHLSRHPMSLSTIRKDLPDGFEMIITKMIAKDPEERYHTASGLLRDLEMVREHFSENNPLTDFQAGTYDTRMRYIHRHKLYGRDAETDSLMGWYKDLVDLNSILVLVSGYSGVGKSALISEVKMPVIRDHGKFISGKFDQFKKDIPYYGFIEAIQEFIQNLLTEPEDKIDHWRKRIRSALGKNAAIITDVVPHLNKIIGTPPAVAKLQPAEQEARFHMVMLDFIFTFSSATTPLVIFLDDLQWADLSSLGLIKRILQNPRKEHILILGAYRDNEVEAGHPLMITIRQLEEYADQIKTIHLEPLDHETTCLITADSFYMDQEEARKLGELVYAKTKGNPFFIHNFLKSLYDDGYITANKDNVWTWDPEQISQLDYTDNVIDLMTDRLNSLPEDTRSVLKYASVLGNTFYLSDLHHVMNRTGSQVSKDLLPAVQGNYLMSSEKHIRSLRLSSMKEVDDADTQSFQSTSFTFVHDRVQQAAYGMITEDEKAGIHLNTGRALLENKLETEVQDGVFDLLNILIPGVHLLDDDEEKLRIARLCLLAGRKAKDSTAYNLGVRFLGIGKDLLPDNAWEREYRLTYDTLLELGECLYLRNDIDKAVSYFHEILARESSNFDKLKVYYLHSSLHLKEGNTSESLRIGLEALQLYDIRFPEGKKARQVRTLMAIMKYLTLFSTRYHSTDRLMAIKDCEDEEIIAINKLLIDVATSAYQEDKNLMMLVIFEIIKSYLKNGFTDASGFGFSGFSVVVFSSLKLQKRGFSLWDTTMKMHEKTHSPLIKWRLRYTVLCFHHIWRLPFRESFDSLLETIKACVLNGDQIFTGYSVALYNRIRITSGDHLEEVLQEASEQMELIKNVKTGMEFFKPYHQLALVLTGKAGEDSWNDDRYDSGDTIARIKKEGNPTILGIYHSAYTAYLYLAGRYEEALNESECTLPYMENLLGDIIEVWHAFYTSLSIAACFDNMSDIKKRKYRKIFNAHVKNMKYWAKGCAENYIPHFYLMKAEESGMEHKPEKAFAYYEKALEAAEKSECRYVIALTCERAAGYAVRTKYDRIAGNYIRDAWRAYHNWGAVVKCEQLEEQFPGILSDTVSLMKKKEQSAVSDKPVAGEYDLDLNSVMKASQSIASEVKFQDLLKKLMHVIIENAGAERGCFLLRKENKLYLEAMGVSGKDGVEILDSVPLEGSDLVPESFIHYVWRTEELQVMNNAGEDPRFESDPYVQKNNVVSMMCLPVTSRGQINSFIYLENNQLKGAFDVSRVSLLQMLSGQIGISVENSLLYENLEEKVKERTREIEKTLKELKTTQTQLIHSEKMASLGELTAGIAHEIQNPLNFVNNFSEVSGELLDEMMEELKDGNMEEVDEILEDIKSNLEKIHHHGKRADAIVKGMLHHSRSGSGQKELTDINALCEEYLRLAYHGLRAKDKSFNAEMDIEFEDGLPQLRVIPQELGRVLLNLITNAFYAVNERSKEGLENYKPRVCVSTFLSSFPPLQEDKGEGYGSKGVVSPSGGGARLWRTGEDQITISISDNGNGIPKKVLDKIFQPFFTTKPTGEGTGLGLSMSYDIVTKGHDGELKVDTVEGEGTTFSVILPLGEELKMDPSEEAVSRISRDKK